MKQKVELYFDENFPAEVIESIKTERKWTKRFRILSARDFGNSGRDDRFHFNFCRRKGFTLVTLDDDFMNDRKYPITDTPGIIRIVAGKNQINKIHAELWNLLAALKHFPLPRLFVGNTKFQIGEQEWIIRGADAKSKEVKQFRLAGSYKVSEIMKFFGFLI